MARRIERPAEVYPRVGELYRLLYAFRGGDPTGTEIVAVYGQVGNDPRWQATGFLWAGADKQSILPVDAVVEMVPRRFNDLESMLSAVRRFSLAAGRRAELIAVESIRASELTPASRERSARAARAVTEFREPAPESLEREPSPGVLRSAAMAWGEAVLEAPERITRALAPVVETTGVAAGRAAGGLAGGALTGVLRWQVLLVIAMVLAAVVLLARNITLRL